MISRLNQMWREEDGVLSFEWTLLLTLLTTILFRLLRRIGHVSFFGSLTLVGLFVLVAFQAAINIGMNVGLAPVTGITLPFVSHGGFSLITSFAMLGMLMAFSHRNAVDARAMARVKREPESQIELEAVQ